MKQHSENMPMSLQDAHGEVPYGMTNDYMFRAVLQSNNKVLRGLICSLLHLSESEVNTVVITNPIVLGADVADKEFRLDINVILNNKILINLKTHQTYSDGLTLNVLDLTRIDLATEEDKKYRIHEWAELFKATTWEEIKMLASKNEYLQEASETIFRMSADDLIRKQCLDREEHYQDMRNYERKIEQDRLEHERDKRDYERVIAEKEEKIEQLSAALEALKQQT